MKRRSSENLRRFVIVAGLVIAAVAAGGSSFVAAEARTAVKAATGKTMSATSASALSPHSDAVQQTRTSRPDQVKQLECRKHGSKRCQ
jgi:fructoselysine-6-P-deglycase FrlB-like protein